MLRWRTVLTLMLSAPVAAVAAAQPAAQRREAASPHLRGLSSAEADALVGTLQELQRRLRDGEQLVFELLSGAPASWPMTTVSPRDAFLQMPFGNPLIIERVRTDNRLWQPYKLIFAPDRPDRPVWDVEVVLGVNGQVERIMMIYKPSAPF